VSSYPHIEQVLIKKYDVKPEAINPAATLAELGLDSLSVAELIFDLSDHYGIDIPDERLDFTTLGEAVALVDEYVSAKAS
jgi:acyl carrier protein